MNTNQIARIAALVGEPARTATGLMFSAATRYRAFEGAYVRAAGEEGMPAPLAKELVRAMRPGNLWKDWRGSKSPVTAPPDPMNDRDIAWQPAQPARRRHGG